MSPTQYQNPTDTDDDPTDAYVSNFDMFPETDEEVTMPQSRGGSEMQAALEFEDSIAIHAKVPVSSNISHRQILWCVS